MAYAIRFQSAWDQGMLVEMSRKAIDQAEKAQREACEREEAWHDTPDCARPYERPQPHPYPHYEAVTADYARNWVRNDWPHETLLYISDGKVRRA